MPVHATPFATAPDLHSLDWAGQIGKQRDPVTNAPIAGWIYDCNSYGHTTRPYAPPRNSTAYAAMHFFGTYGWIGAFDYSTVLQLVTGDEGVNWSGYQNADGRQVWIHIDLSTGPEAASANATYEDPQINTLLLNNMSANTETTFRLYDTLPGTDYVCDVDTSFLAPIPPSPDQYSQRDRFAAAQAAWANLTYIQRRAYNVTAKRFNLSGQNLFIRQWLAENP